MNHTKKNRNCSCVELFSFITLTHFIHTIIFICIHNSKRVNKMQMVNGSINSLDANLRWHMKSCKNSFGIAKITISNCFYIFLSKVIHREAHLKLTPYSHILNFPTLTSITKKTRHKPLIILF